MSYNFKYMKRLHSHHKVQYNRVYFKLNPVHLSNQNSLRLEGVYNLPVNNLKA